MTPEREFLWKKSQIQQKLSCNTPLLMLNIDEKPLLPYEARVKAYFPLKGRVFWEISFLVGLQK